jgi:hydrogenase maturation protease
MAERASSSIVIGVGNLARGDDAAGRKAARLLRGMALKDVSVVETNGEAAELIEMISGVKTAFLIDACVSGAEPGTIRRIDAAKTGLARGVFGLSTHGFGLAEAIELARTLACLPPCCIVYAIEGASFEIGATLSLPVARAVARVAELLCGEITNGRVAEREFACTKLP